MAIIWSEFSKRNIKDFNENSKMLHKKSYINDLIKYVNILVDYPKLGKKTLYYNG